MNWLNLAVTSLLFTSIELVASFPTIPQESGYLAENTTTSQAEVKSKNTQRLPFLIDRDLFFGNPDYGKARLSPTGEYIAFQKPHNGVLNIWVKGLNEPLENARPVTSATDNPIQFFQWSADEKYLLYLQDKGGTENYHVYAVNPKNTKERDLTPFDGVQARMIQVPKETPNTIIVGLNKRDPELHDVYKINLETGQEELLIQNNENINEWFADEEGNVRLATRQTNEGGTEVLQVNDNSFNTVYSCSFGEECEPIRFHKDNQRVYMTTNKGENVNLKRMILFNPNTKEEELVAVDPQEKVDFKGGIFSEATDELLATVYVDGRQRIYAKDEAFAEDLDFLKQSLPDGNLSFTFPKDDPNLILVDLEQDINPRSLYLFNRQTRNLTKLYESRPNLPSDELALMQPIHYEARDGVEIPAYLTLPRGVKAENLPVIIFPHGGPWSRDTWGYDAEVQFLANRGYAVLQPNYRGSTGYGKAFLNAGNEEWGRGVMQQDLSDGVKYLIEEGIADPERVGIFGGSYGGYATLAGLAFTPELYSAGVSYVGPSNLITLIRSIPPYWKPLSQTFYKRVGNPNKPEDRLRLRQQSPLYFADQIDDPLMVIQGANDPRVKKQESDQIVAALREEDQDVKYLVAPNEGHGFEKPTNRLASMAALEEFFAQYLGGRYQESMQSKVQERLEALTVNVDNVTTQNIE